MKNHLKLLPRFAISMGILGIILTVFVSYFAYSTSAGYLEDMYADKVVAGSKSVATMLSLDDVKTIISDGGDSSEAYTRVFSMLNTIKLDSNVTYLSLVVPGEKSVTFYIDACVEELGDNPANQLAYGTEVLYTDAVNDESEMEKYNMVWQLYSENKGTDEPFITDNDYGYNFTSVTPILDENGNAIAEIQYIIDMQGVRDQLNRFLYSMLLACLIIISICVIGYIFFARRSIIRPIEKLNKFAGEIVSSGQIKDQSISIKTGDEIEGLGNAFNTLLKWLEEYIENLTKATAEKERIGAELDLATNIQASMLPNIFPAFPDRKEIDIYAFNTPAKEVGGDFYDFFMLDDKNLAFVMADVSGKGVPAALFMVIGKTLIKDNTLLENDLGQVFTRVNNLLCESNEYNMFITAFEGILNLETGQLRYVNAGHEMPFIYHKNKNAYEMYEIEPGFVLAGLEDIEYKEYSLQLEVGDKIYQYTDGVNEATTWSQEMYGMDRLTNILNKCLDDNVTDTLKKVKADIDVFVDGSEPYDDITMLCLEYKEKYQG